MTVDNRVTIATSNHKLFCNAFEETLMKSPKALCDNVNPIIIDTEPVIEAGNNFSTASFPHFLTINQAAIEIKPDMIIPN